MDQLWKFAIVLNSSSVSFLRFLLTGFKITGRRSEEHNNSPKGKGKQELVIIKKRLLFSQVYFIQ